MITVAIRQPAGLPAPLRDLKRTLVMGVLNVTPDSFSDGGRWFDTAAAISQGEKLLRQGADLIDIGGESTRPGAHRVSASDELARVMPVVTELVAAGAQVSIDTMNADVALAAVERGAVLINDVSGGLVDPKMAHVVAETGVPYVCMHWRAHGDVMAQYETYGDVVADVRAELAARIGALTAVGVAAEQIVLDPGLGFAKAGHHNWPLLAHLDALQSLGHPVLVGASRKRFLGHLLANAAGEPAPPAARDRATDAITALAAASGVWCVRVHEVEGSVDAVKVAAAWRAAASETGSE